MLKLPAFFVVAAATCSPFAWLALDTRPAFESGGRGYHLIDRCTIQDRSSRAFQTSSRRQSDDGKDTCARRDEASQFLDFWF